MVKITAILEVLKALFKPVTTDYPKGPPTHVPPGIRGLPQFDEDKCIGCGACMTSCTSGAIDVIDQGANRTVDVSYMRCLFCGRCEEICPEEGGIVLSDKFELATTNKAEAHVTIKLKLTKCKSCGAPITATKQLERIKERILGKTDPKIPEEITRDLPKYLELCFECRKKQSYALDIHTRKFYLRRWET
ncbi:MAG: 4Fe-4S binding protein [Promethearchaeota archaeon]